MKYQKILWGFIFSCLFIVVNAQSSNPKKRIEDFQPVYQQLIFVGGGGMSWLYYKPKVGNSVVSGNGKIGIEYGVWFTKNWGIRMGLHLDYFSGGIKADAFKGTTIHKPNDTLRYTYTNYQEKNQILMLSIPLMGQYEYAFSPKLSLYTALGIKVGIPFFATTHITGNLVGTTSIEVDANAEKLISAFDRPVDQQQFLNLNALATLAVEIGVKHPLKNNWTLYTGLYCDYGLNSMSPGNNSLVSHSFNNPYELVYRSMASASKLHPLLFGISIKVSKDKMGKTKS